MMQPFGFTQSFVDVDGVKTEIWTKGEGRPIIFLHPGDGLLGAGAALDALAKVAWVIAPSHPGFGQSELCPAITTVDDLSYFYLDFLDSLGLTDAVMLGASFGGWIAAQIAVKNTRCLGKLVLVDSLGIKIGGRETRDIADLHALDEDEKAAISFADPDRFRPQFETFSDDALITLAKNREAFTLLGWRPYMHDPKLRRRLRRIHIPTLVVWGAADRIVLPEYGRHFCSEIPKSRFELVEDAGHYPYLEQPERFSGLVREFILN